jgi:hypothetical protein
LWSFSSGQGFWKINDQYLIIGIWHWSKGNLIHLSSSGGSDSSGSYLFI